MDAGLLNLTDHPGWITDSDLFSRSINAIGRFRMNAFYRLARRSSGILMSKDKSIGGKYSFDSDNRLAWTGKPPAPGPLAFSSDEIKDEVCDLVERKFGDAVFSMASQTLADGDKMKPKTLEILKAKRNF